MSSSQTRYVPWDGESSPPPKEKWQFYVQSRKGYDPDKNGLHLSRWAPQNRHMLTQKERDKIAADARAEQLRAQRQQARNSNKSSSSTESMTLSEVAVAHSSGGLTSSRWASKPYSSPSSTKAPAVGLKTIKVVEPAPAPVNIQSAAPKTSSSSYIPPHMRGQVPVPKPAPQAQGAADAIPGNILSTRSLSPEATEFVPSSLKQKITSPRSLSPEAEVFKPNIKENFTTTRTLSPEAREFKPSRHQPVSTQVLNPQFQVTSTTQNQAATAVTLLSHECSERTVNLETVSKPVPLEKLPPHLQATVHNAKVSKLDTSNADTPKTPKADASYVPPHLRGLAPTQKLAPHLQVIVEFSKTTSLTPVQISLPCPQVANQSPEAASTQAVPEELVEVASSDQAAPATVVVTTLADQESHEALRLPAPPKNGGLTSVADYTTWLKLKNERDLAAKQKSIAQRAALLAQGPVITRGDTWRQPPTGQVIAVARHNHFQVDINKDPTNFQAFLKQKEADSVNNGKKYHKLSKLSPNAPPFVAQNRTPSPIELNAKAAPFTPTTPSSLPKETEEHIATDFVAETVASSSEQADEYNGVKISTLVPSGRSLSPEAAEFTPRNWKEKSAPIRSLSREAATFFPASKEASAPKDVGEDADFQVFEPISDEIIAAIEARPGLAASKWASADNSKHLLKSGRQKVVKVEIAPQIVQLKDRESKMVEPKVNLPSIIKPNTFELNVCQPNVAEPITQHKVESKAAFATEPPSISQTVTITNLVAPVSKPVVAPLVSGTAMNRLQESEVDPRVAKFRGWMANRHSPGVSTSVKTDSHSSSHDRIKAGNQMAVGKAAIQIPKAPSQKVTVPLHPHSNAVTKMTVDISKEVVSNVATSSGGWDAKPAAPNFNMIIAEAALVPANNGEKLTQDVLNKNWGPCVSNYNSNSFDAKISDAGVVTITKENVRNTQGNDPAEELLDWDNSWRPAPCDWEDRGNFDNTYMNDYIISDWQPHLPHGKVNFDLSDPGYNTGDCPVKNLDLEPQYEHDKTLALTGPLADRDAILFQTSENAAFKYNEINLKRQQERDALKVVPVAGDQIQYMNLGPHEFAPDVDMYLRPAQPSDAAQIAGIYNHYVNTNPTEDLEPVSEAIIKQLGRTSKEEKLPFLVAVKGHAPVATPTRSGQNVLIPPNETILGFSVARTWSYGINGLRSGRSRLTVNLEVFVRPDSLRKGIGRSLLDRLLQCCSPSYAGRDGYSWVNPDPKDDVYGKPGGVYYLYSLVIQIIAPAGKAKETDDDFLWKRDFLRKYWFDEEAVLKGFSRSSRAVPEPKFFDNVIFTKLAALEGEVPPFA